MPRFNCLRNYDISISGNIQKPQHECLFAYCHIVSFNAIRKIFRILSCKKKERSAILILYV